MKILKTVTTLADRCMAKHEQDIEDFQRFIYEGLKTEKKETPQEKRHNQRKRSEAR